MNHAMRATALCLSLMVCPAIPFQAQTAGQASGPPHVSEAERVKRGLPLDADITPPRVIFAPEPLFPEDVRKHKGAWDILVHVRIDKEGHAHDANIVRGVGYGFDECAVAAVNKYRFKPAMQDGTAIAWDMNVEIKFQVF